MKLDIAKYSDGWRLGIWGRDIYFLRRLSKEQAERALNLYKDSPIDWDNIPELYKASDNTQCIVARLTVLVSKEFGMSLEELVTENQTALELIRKGAARLPT